MSPKKIDPANSRKLEDEVGMLMDKLDGSAPAITVESPRGGTGHFGEEVKKQRSHRSRTNSAGSRSSQADRVNRIIG